MKLGNSRTTFTPHDNGYLNQKQKWFNIIIPWEIQNWSVVEASEAALSWILGLSFFATELLLIVHEKEAKQFINSRHIRSFQFFPKLVA